MFDKPSVVIYIWLYHLYTYQKTTYIIKNTKRSNDEKSI